MSENHEHDANETLAIDALNSGKSANRMILISTPQWVKGVIYRLHSLGFAEMSEWSRLTPTRNPKEMISMLQRPRVQD